MTVQHQIHLDFDCRGQYTSSGLGPEAEDKLSSAFIGSSGNVCDIMKGRRNLSLAMIRRLHSGLGIPAQILIQEYTDKRS